MYLLAFAETIQLFPDGTLLIHVALILLMIWVLNRTLYRPLNRIIDSRERSKGGRSSEAGSILKDVQAKEALYTQEMRDTRSKGYELTEKEQKEAIAERERQISDAKAAVADRFTAERAELESRAAEAHTVIGTEAAKMADKIAANILKA